MTVFRRLPASLLILTMIALGCDLGAACALAQASEAGCCCPVEGPSPCMEAGETGEMPFSTDRDASLDNGKPAQAALLPSASILPTAGFGHGTDTRPGILGSEGRGGTAVHVLCCVYLC